MAEFVGRHVAREMLVLGLLELLLTFALAYVVLMPESGPLELRTFNYALLLAGTVGFTAFIVGLYRSQSFTRSRNLVVNTALGALLAFPAAWLVSVATGLDAYWPVGHDALRPIKVLGIWTGALLAVRFLFLFAMQLKLFSHRVALLDLGDLPATVAAIRGTRRGLVDVVSPPPNERSPEALRRAKVRGAIMSAAAVRTLPPSRRAEFEAAGIQIETEAEFWESHLRRVNIAQLDDAWVETLDRKGSTPVRDVVHRTGDIVTSLALLCATLPLMLVMIVWIRLDSRGPAFYRQERVGRKGECFTLFKFRSMRTDAEDRGPAWAQQRDPRITRIGSFMRRTRIDELPQLLNILRGEMGFIGPRPERPHFVERLAEAIPYYRERARVKPGLTGWAQVSYPYGASVEDAKAKLSYDLYYVKNRSFMLDILILFATVRVILFQEGAR